MGPIPAVLPGDAGEDPPSSVSPRLRRSATGQRANDRAGERVKVIRTATDIEGERPTSIRLPAKAAVSALADEMRRRREEIMPIVRHYDSHVGDGYLDMPLEQRITAAEAANTPWQFAYILRGGWSQAKGALDNLRNFNRADLLLFVIASRQIISLDAGCTFEQAADSIAALGGAPTSRTDGLDLLRRQTAILPGMPIRCPHVQTAVVVVQRFFLDRRDAHFAAAISLLRVACVDGQTPLRGISWLLRELYLTGAFRGGRIYQANHPVAKEARLRAGASREEPRI
jgi:hypothetical protein